jgi:hypothetical protein
MQQIATTPPQPTIEKKEGAGMSDGEKEGLKQTIRFLKFEKTKAEKKAAYERYDASASALELAQIKERLAEMGSMSDPLSRMTKSTMIECDRCYTAAYYVVVGRLPQEV